MGRLIILLVAFFIVVILNLMIGSIHLSLSELLASDIFWQLRLSRTLVAIMAGALLALSGHITQILFRNPLATPYTLGVASSAGLGAMIAMSFGLSFIYITGISFVTALVGLIFLGFLAFFRRVETSTLLLLGVAINLFCSGAISVIQVSAAKFDLTTYLQWVMGSVSVVGNDIVWRFILAGCLFVPYVYKQHRNLSLYQVEGEAATTRGFDPKRLLIVSLSLMTVVVAVIVSSIGPIGFIGLVVPHLCRNLFANSGRIQQLANLLMGATVLVLADFINRNLFSDAGLPVGVMTTVFGAPVLMYILLKRS